MAKTLTGVVSSSKADKTITVTVVTRKTHPIYKKQYSENKKFMAHDENNEAEVGDKVIISEVRPISARKRFTLAKIVERPALREDDVKDILKEDTEAKKAKKADEATEGEDV
jgi:small subunit ribosomal protein S17